MDLLNIVSKSADQGNRIIRFIGSDESIDRDGDTIAANGWMLDNYLKNPVVLYGHDYYDLPIGKAIAVFVDQTRKELVFDIYFPTIEELTTNPATPSEHALKVDAIYNMAKAGILNTVSVGFKGIDYEATATGRAYKQQELMEISIVPVPANPNALAVLRASGAADSIIKGVTTMAEVIEKAGAKVSKESRAVLRKVCDDMKACAANLESFLGSDEEPEAEEPKAAPEMPKEPEAEKAADDNNFVIDLVEKNLTDANK